MRFLREQVRILAIAGVLLVAAVVTYYAGWLQPFEHWLSVSVQPGLGLAYATIDSFSPLYSTTDDELLQENRDLKSQLTSIIQQNHELSTQIGQYEEYKAELAFAQQKDYEFISAKVITRVGDNSVGQWLYINRGSQDQIQPGFPIVYGPGMLLGVVQTVHDSYSEVRLLTNDDTRLQGQTETATPTTGVLSGQFGTSLSMQYILKDQPIAVQDVIVTNGQDRYVPAGLVLGTVQQVNDVPSELFKSAVVTPLVRYGNNAIVSVVIPKNQ